MSTDNNFHALDGNVFALYIEGALCPVSRMILTYGIDIVPELYVEMPATMNVRQFTPNLRVTVLFKDNSYQSELGVGRYCVYFEGKIHQKGFIKTIHAERRFTFKAKHITTVLEAVSLKPLEASDYIQAVITGASDTQIQTATVTGSVFEMFTYPQIRASMKLGEKFNLHTFVKYAFLRYKQLSQDSLISEQYAVKQLDGFNLIDRFYIPDPDVEKNIQWDNIFNQIMINYFNGTIQSIIGNITFLKLIQMYMQLFLHQIMIHPNPKAYHQTIQVKQTNVFSPIPNCNMVLPMFTPQYEFFEDWDNKPTRLIQLSKAPGNIANDPLLARYYRNVAPQELSDLFEDYTDQRQKDGSNKTNLSNLSLEAINALTKVYQDKGLLNKGEKFNLITREERERGIIERFNELPAYLASALEAAVTPSTENTTYNSSGSGSAYKISGDEVFLYDKNSISKVPDSTLLKEKLIIAGRLLYVDNKLNNFPGFIKSGNSLRNNEKVTVPDSIVFCKKSNGIPSSPNFHVSSTGIEQKRPRYRNLFPFCNTGFFTLKVNATKSELDTAFGIKQDKTSNWGSSVFIIKTNDDTTKATKVSLPSPNGIEIKDLAQNATVVSAEKTLNSTSSTLCRIVISFDTASDLLANDVPQKIAYLMMLLKGATNKKFETKDPSKVSPEFKDYLFTLSDIAAVDTSWDVPSDIMGQLKELVVAQLAVIEQDYIKSSEYHNALKAKINDGQELFTTFDKANFSNNTSSDVVTSPTSGIPAPDAPPGPPLKTTIPVTTNADSDSRKTVSNEVYKKGHKIIVGKLKNIPFDQRDSKAKKLADAIKPFAEKLSSKLSSASAEDIFLYFANRFSSASSNNLNNPWDVQPNTVLSNVLNSSTKDLTKQITDLSNPLGSLTSNPLASGTIDATAKIADLNAQKDLLLTNANKLASDQITKALAQLKVFDEKKDDIIAGIAKLKKEGDKIIATTKTDIEKIPNIDFMALASSMASKGGQQFLGALQETVASKTKDIADKAAAFADALKTVGPIKLAIEGVAKLQTEITTKKAQATAASLKQAQDDAEKNVNADPAKQTDLASLTQSELDPIWRKYTQPLALYYFYYNRYLNQNANMPMVFNPYITPGYCGIVVDNANAKEQMHLLFYCSMVTQDIEHNHIQTSVKMDLIRPLDEYITDTKPDKKVDKGISDSILAGDKIPDNAAKPNSTSKLFKILEGVPFLGGEYSTNPITINSNKVTPIDVTFKRTFGDSSNKVGDGTDSATNVRMVTEAMMQENYGVGVKDLTTAYKLVRREFQTCKITAADVNLLNSLEKKYVNTHNIWYESCPSKIIIEVVGSNNPNKKFDYSINDFPTRIVLDLSNKATENASTHIPKQLELQPPFNTTVQDFVDEHRMRCQTHEGLIGISSSILSD